MSLYLMIDDPDEHARLLALSRRLMDDPGVPPPPDADERALLAALAARVTDEHDPQTVMIALSEDERRSLEDLAHAVAEGDWGDAGAADTADLLGDLALRHRQMRALPGEPPLSERSFLSQFLQTEDRLLLGEVIASLTDELIDALVGDESGARPFTRSRFHRRLPRVDYPPRFARLMLAALHSAAAKLAGWRLAHPSCTAEEISTFVIFKEAMERSEDAEQQDRISFLHEIVFQDDDFAQGWDISEPRVKEMADEFGVPYERGDAIREWFEPFLPELGELAPYLVARAPRKESR